MKKHKRLEKVRINTLLVEFEDIAYEYYTTEIESAPSGEWAEYNVVFLQNEASYETMKDCLLILGLEKQMNAIENRLIEELGL